MDEQLKIQNQQQIVTEKRNEEQKRVAMLLENLKKDVETARRHYNTAATKEAEKLERIMRPEDLEAYIR